MILSCSLSEASNSRTLARELHRAWNAGKVASELLDLRDFDLPLCDGENAYTHPAARRLTPKLTSADAVVFAVPIYNYDVNAAAKNVIELAGGQLQNKVAGFLCAAGGQKSYMSVMAIANSLMLDFRTVIVPRFVYAAGDDFREGEELSEAIRERIAGFGDEFQKLAQAVTAVR